jgi:hypothetical protein
MHSNIRPFTWVPVPESGLGILPLPYKYIFLLMKFVVNNQGHLQTNSAEHNINTRNRGHLHTPITNF